MAKRSGAARTACGLALAERVVRTNPDAFDVLLRLMASMANENRRKKQSRRRELQKV